MKEKPADPHPLSDLAYDQYIKDAERAGSAECVSFFRKVHDADKAQLAEAREHLVAVLQGKMGNG